MLHYHGITHNYEHCAVHTLVASSLLALVSIQFTATVLLAASAAIVDPKDIHVYMMNS